MLCIHSWKATFLDGPFSRGNVGLATLRALSTFSKAPTTYPHSGTKKQHQFGQVPHVHPVKENGKSGTPQDLPRCSRQFQANLRNHSLHTGLINYHWCSVTSTSRHLTALPLQKSRMKPKTMIWTQLLRHSFGNPIACHWMILFEPSMKQSSNGQRQAMETCCGSLPSNPIRCAFSMQSFVTSKVS